MHTKPLATALCASLALGATSLAKRIAPAPEPERPKVEVCFVLDTTGSMGGLIAGAKQKIWSIANDLTNAEPSPDLKIGLVAYRDRGDQYVTQKFALTDDLDAIYENLMKFQASGGGDGPESVNQALHEAVQDIEWSKDRDVLKIIFLVGDFPPHMDYQDDVKYPDTCKAAVRKDIIINTVQCGNHAPTTPIWKEIAHMSEGTYAAIEQRGGMAAVESPVDGRIAELTRAINGTVIAYGDFALQLEAKSKLAAAESAPAATAAARQSFFRKKLAGKAISGGGDLLAAIEDGEVALDAVETEKLDEKYQSLAKEELAALVGEKSAERGKLQAELDGLLVKRDEHVKAELAKRRADSKDDGFDAQIRRAVQAQGAKKGIEYKAE